MSKEWRITLLNFVDNNCVVFDNEEENKFEYTTIHNVLIEKLRNLKSWLLACLIVSWMNWELIH